MNLNISTQNIGNFQGNNNNNKSLESESEFKDIFKEVENLIEDSGLDINMNEDNDDDDINYDLIQNILNSIQLNSQVENADLNSFKNIDAIDFEDFIDALKNNNLQLENIKETQQNNSLFEELISQKEMILNKLNKGNSEVLNSIKEILESQNKDAKEINNIEKNPLLQNIVLDNLEEINSVEDNFEATKNQVNYSNLNKELKLDIKGEDQYNQLEVSSLSNKSNIVQKNNTDNDLITLESILDGSDSNNFLFPNNIGSDSIDYSNNESIDTQPIKEIRQEFIGNDIVKTVKYLKSNGIEEINIKISPRELGDMTIKLIKNLEETKVVITITKEDVFDLVNKNIGDITNHLNELNIKVKEVSVDIKNDSQKFFSDNLNQQFNKKNQQNQKKKNKYNNIESENIEEIKEAKAKNDNLNILI